MGTWEIFNVGGGRAMKWTAQLNKSGRSCTWSAFERKCNAVLLLYSMSRRCIKLGRKKPWSGVVGVLDGGLARLPRPPTPHFSHYFFGTKLLHHTYNEYKLWLMNKKLATMRSFRNDFFFFFIRRESYRSVILVCVFKSPTQLISVIVACFFRRIIMYIFLIVVNPEFEHLGAELYKWISYQ